MTQTSDLTPVLAILEQLPPYEGLGFRKCMATENFSTEAVDRALAEREGLAGDFYNGWHGAALVSELTDVVETVTSLKRGPS